MIGPSGFMQAPKNDERCNMSKLLTQKDLIDYLQVTRQTIYQWRRRGIFPKPYQIGKFLRWKQEDIDQFVNQHTARI